MIESNISQSLKTKIKSTSLRISGIVEESIVDGPGIRLVIFTQGCKHNCKECHNSHTHSFNGGYDIDIEDIIDLVQANPLLDGITLSGGDPFEQALTCSILATKVKELGLNVIAYTGYTFEEISKNNDYKKLLSSIDILIDGKFEIAKKDLTLAFRGSRNQRIINVKNSIYNNTIELVGGYHV